MSPSQEECPDYFTLNGMIFFKAKICTKVKQARKTIFKDTDIGEKGHSWVRIQLHWNKRNTVCKNGDKGGES